MPAKPRTRRASPKRRKSGSKTVCPPRKVPRNRAKATKPRGDRAGTKQALLIDLLKRKKGATIEAIVETLGWLPQTVRAALTRLRQQGFRIERVRQDGVSRYRIAEDRKAA